MELKGTIKKIFDTQTFSSGFKKREFVLTVADNPDYPQHLKIELIKDKCALLDDCKVGQELTVAINLNGNEWTSPDGEVKYFVSLLAWKLDKGQVIEQAPQKQGDWMQEENDGDLPF